MDTPRAHARCGAVLPVSPASLAALEPLGSRSEKLQVGKDALVDASLEKLESAPRADSFEPRELHYAVGPRDAPEVTPRAAYHTLARPPVLAPLPPPAARCLIWLEWAETEVLRLPGVEVIMCCGREGATALSVLKAAHKVEQARGGYISAIDGVREQWTSSTRVYWSFWVNRQFSTLPESQHVCKENETLEWILIDQTCLDSTTLPL